MTSLTMLILFFKRFSLFFLLISASLFPTSFAGGRSKFVSKLAADHDVDKIMGTSVVMNEEEVAMIHERLLRANTKDYGRYDPSPSFSKPPYKLIPN